MAETTALPTADNTVAEIKSYLDAAGISYSSSATKADLLALLPVEAAPTESEPQPAPQEPYYTKAELLDLVGGRMHDYLLIALKNGRAYTYKEALQAVDDWKHSGTIF